MAKKIVRKQKNIRITESENKILLFVIGLVVGIASATAALKQWYEYAIPAICAALVVLWLLNR